MKKFTINCDFGGQMAPFAIYIGKPEKKHHPLHFQADWLSKQRGGMIPSEVMDAVGQLQELAEKNGVSLEELCVYALGTDEEKQAASEEEVPQDDESQVNATSLNMDDSEPDMVDEDQLEENIDYDPDYEDEFLIPDEDDNDGDYEEEDDEDGDDDDFDELAAEEDMTSEGGHVEDDMAEESPKDKK